MQEEFLTLLYGGRGWDAWASLYTTHSIKGSVPIDCSFGA